MWGLSFVVIKVGLNQLPPFLFSALRFALAAIPAVFFVPFPKNHWKAVLGIGIFIGIFKFSFLFISLDGHITAGLASLLIQSQIYFTVILSIIMFKETITSLHVKGFLVALLGFLTLLTSGSQAFTTLGLLMILLAGLSWAFSNIIMKKMKDVNLFQLMVWACLVPPVPLFVISILTETDQPMYLLAQLNFMSWVSVTFLAFCSTLLAYALWGVLLRKYSAASITPMALLIPIVGMISSVLVLGEEVAFIEVISFLLIFLGLVAVMLANVATGETFTKKSI